MMNKSFYLLSLACWLSSQAIAHQQRDSLKSHVLYVSQQNFRDNLLSDIQNPVKIAYNSVQHVTQASLVQDWSNGRFHAIDQARKHSQQTFRLYGLHQVGKFSLEGAMSYQHKSETSQRWNNTLMLSTYNPFVLADSITGNPQQEVFSLEATAAYRLSQQWKAALHVAYVTGSRDDQTDPRPHTTSMRFVVSPGASVMLANRYLLGFQANLTSYSSDIAHTVVNNLSSNTYFLMKGMGEFYAVATSQTPSYPRHYQGLTLGGTSFFKSLLLGAQNVIEIGYTHTSERAEDLGTTSLFKGGDYQSGVLSVYDRLALPTHHQLYQSFTLSFQHQQDKGFWYDQRAQVDTEHGNRTYYEILHKGKVHEATITQLSLGYHIERWQDQQPLWIIHAQGGIFAHQLKHYDDAITRQSYQNLWMNIEGQRYLIIKKLRWQVLASLGGRTNLGTPTYHTPITAISDAYVAPVFAYQTASFLSSKVGLKTNIPLTLYHSTVWLSPFVEVKGLFHLGTDKMSNLYQSTSQTFVHVGASLTL